MGLFELWQNNFQIMNSEELKQRTMQFAFRSVVFVKSLSYDMATNVMAKQFLRSATSVAANYRAASRSRSRAEFLAKISIVVEESDESLFWLELLHKCETNESKALPSLLQEAKELVYIFSKSCKSTRDNINISKNNSMK